MKILIKNQIVVKTALLSDEIRSEIEKVVQLSNFEILEMPGHIAIQATSSSSWDDFSKLYNQLAEIIKSSIAFCDGSVKSAPFNEEEEVKRLHQFIYTRQISSFAPSTESEQQLKPKSTFIFISDKNQSKNNGISEITNAITIRPKMLYAAKYIDNDQNNISDHEDEFTMNKQSLKGTAYVSIELLKYSIEKNMVTFTVSVIQSTFLVSHSIFDITSFSFIRECALPDNAVLAMDKTGRVNLGKVSFQDLAHTIADRGGWFRNTIFNRMYDSFEYELNMSLKNLLISYFKEENGKFAINDTGTDKEHELELLVVANKLITGSSRISYSGEASEVISINGNDFDAVNSPTSYKNRTTRAENIQRVTKVVSDTLKSINQKTLASNVPLTKKIDSYKKNLHKRSKYIIISASSGDMGMSPEARMIIVVPFDKAKINISILIASIAINGCICNADTSNKEFENMFITYNKLSRHPIETPVCHWFEEPNPIAHSEYRINEITYADDGLEELISSLSIKDYSKKNIDKPNIPVIDSSKSTDDSSTTTASAECEMPADQKEFVDSTDSQNLYNHSDEKYWELAAKQKQEQQEAAAPIISTKCDEMPANDANLSTPTDEDIAHDNVINSNIDHDIDKMIENEDKDPTIQSFKSDGSLTVPEE